MQKTTEEGKTSSSVNSPLQFGNDEERDSRGVFYDSRGLLHKQELLKKEPVSFLLAIFNKIIRFAFVEYIVNMPGGEKMNLKELFFTSSALKLAGCHTY